MKEFTLETIKSICDAAALPLGIPFIDARLDGYQERWAGGHPYYAALHDISKALEPGIIVEIGTWQGTSAACFAAGFPGAEVITIDHHSDPGDDQNQNQTQYACDEYDNILYVQGCSTEMVHKLKPGTKNVFPMIQNYLGDTKIDILFIDGWHGGEFARADFDTYAPLLGPGSLVICDDICGGDGAAIFGMRKFWDDLPGEKYLDGRIHPGYPMGFVKGAV